MRADTHDPPADKSILRPYYSNNKNLSTCYVCSLYSIRNMPHICYSETISLYQQIKV